MMKPEKKRLNVDLYPEEVERLERLLSLTEARSKSQVIREALKTYEASLKKRKEGWA